MRIDRHEAEQERPGADDLRERVRRGVSGAEETVGDGQVVLADPPHDEDETVAAVFQQVTRRPTDKD